MQKHGKVVCRECDKTMYQGRKPENKTIHYGRCADCQRFELRQKKKGVIE